MMRNKILLEREKLYKKLNQIQLKIKKFPEGELLCAKNGKYTKCYLLSNDGTCPTYIPKGNDTLVEDLAIKKYYSLQMKELSDEINILNKCLKQYSKFKIRSESLLSETSCYKKYLKSVISTPSDKLKNLLNANHMRNLSYPENLKHRSVSGQYLRSKSEVIIANALYLSNIPFIYECGITLDGATLFPDFTICHPKTNEIFYWEHFGKMDDQSYSDSTFNKLKIYSHHGIIPTINLITTFETLNNPIDSEKIQQIINDYFFE